MPHITISTFVILKAELLNIY